MKRFANQAAWFAYIGAIVAFIGFDPNLSPWAEHSVLLHSLSHVLIFAGAAMFFYGTETLRKLAARYRRLTN